MLRADVDQRKEEEKITYLGVEDGPVPACRGGGHGRARTHVACACGRG